jgi:hypothetical protein
MKINGCTRQSVSYFIDETAAVNQCYGSGSGAFLTHGSGMGKKSRSGSGIRDEHPGHFLELRNNFLGLKLLKFFVADLDPGSGIFLTLDLESEKEKFGSGINMPDPQHCGRHYCEVQMMVSVETLSLVGRLVPHLLHSALSWLLLRLPPLTLETYTFFLM